MLGILVDSLDHALCVLDLVDRVLQLLVEHLAIRNDDHAVKYLLVLRIVQAGQPVRQPRDAVGLTAARRMLD
ncbi:hypothetical protein D3C81_2303690 [compost metagenome]